MSGNRIVHSYSPRKELLKRALIGFLGLVVLLVLAAGGIFAFRSLGHASEPSAPLEERVVQVDVQPDP